MATTLFEVSSVLTRGPQKQGFPTCTHSDFPLLKLKRTMTLIAILLLGTMVSSPTPTPTLSAATLPEGFTDVLIATPLTSPIFVCEQSGQT